MATKPKLKLVKGNPFAPRPYETDYVGMWPGHCKTIESAIAAGHKRLVSGEYRKCTVTGPEGVVARLHCTPLGVLTTSQHIVELRKTVKLKEVKK